MKDGETNDDTTTDLEQQQDPINSSSPPKRAYNILQVPIQIGLGLLVFSIVLTLLNKEEPTTIEEELQAENLVKWCIGNISGAGAMHCIASFQKNLWPLIAAYLTKKRDGEPADESSSARIIDHLKLFVKDWFLNGAAAFSAFAGFSMVSSALTLLNYGPWAMAVFRSMNALGTTGLMSFLHGLTGAAVPAQQMLQLVAALMMVEYAGNIDAVFDSLVGDSLTATQLDWLSVIVVNAAPPAIAALGAGIAYDVSKRIGGFFIRPCSNNNEETAPLVSSAAQLPPPINH